MSLPFTFLAEANNSVIEGSIVSSDLHKPSHKSQKAEESGMFLYFGLFCVPAVDSDQLFA